MSYKGAFCWTLHQVILLAMLLLASFARPAGAQHLYLDANRPLGSTLRGLRLLGYLPVHRDWWLARSWGREQGSVDPTAYGAGVGTDCDGPQPPNTHALDADRLGVDSVWVAGAAGTEGPAPTVTTAGPGKLYLGGNHIGAPYTLSYVAGRLVVNGLALPPVARPSVPAPKYTSDERAQIAFGQHAADIFDSLAAVGTTPEAAAEVLRSMCAANPLIDSIAVTSRAVTWRFADGMCMQIALARRRSGGSSSTRAQMEYGELQQLRNLISMGCTVFLRARGGRVVIPVGKA